jgi:hypothetical protein
MSHCDVAHIHYRRHAVDPRVLARKADLVLSTQVIDLIPEPIRACSTSSGSEKTYFPRLILMMRSSRCADFSVRINASSPLHDRCEQLMTNGSNRGHGFDFVNPSTEPSAYGTG